MRKIITTTFVTLDGVMQAPGGPQEDTSGNFAWGGWQTHYGGEVTGKIINDFMEIESSLLLGKRTYDIFAAYWPHASSDIPVANRFNSATKYVVSNTPVELSWQNSKLITGDVVPQLKKLKEENGPDLWVWGSGELMQTLLAEDLIDRMHIWTHPVTIGSGRRLFANGTKPKAFKLVDTKIDPTGVIIATYEPAGPLVTGTVGE